MSATTDTERLEQRDSYLTGFAARVLEVETVEDSDWVLLDQSAFYPESGGQPADTGTLGDARVVDVQVRQRSVWHRIEGARLVPGDEVDGAIDWERRFRHMQRHTAQHLLSQALLHVDDALVTRSVGLSSPDCTLDLAEEPLDAALAQAEALVSRVVFRNLPITSFEVDETEVGAYPLRRPPKVKGTIRLVKMGDFEISACGGTHLRSTAEAAPIKVLKHERIRGDLTRVTFRAGLEALEDYREKHDVAHGLAVAFSARVRELPERIASLREAERSSALELTALRRRLAEEVATRLRAAHASEADAAQPADAASSSRPFVVVRHVLPSEDAAMLQPLAESLADLQGTVALLGVRDDAKAKVMFARSEGLALDLRPVLAVALERIDGRGGGRPELAQGGGPGAAGLEEALERAAKEVHEQP